MGLKTKNKVKIRRENINQERDTIKYLECAHRLRHGGETHQKP